MYNLILLFTRNNIFTTYCTIGSAAQIVWGIFISLVYIKLYGYYRPFKNLDDDILQEMAQYQVFITLFIALLLRDSKCVEIICIYSCCDMI